MPTCAQTNLQLFIQLRTAGWSEDDLASVHAAYGLGSLLVSGVFTPCGKPLVDHLVGTASLVAWLGRPRAVVLAMLLHAVYAYGDFGARGWRTRARRAEVRGVVGAEAEAQLWAYARLPWSREARAGLRGTLGTLAGREREAVRMRLVNALEQWRDLGGLFCVNGDRRRRGIEREGPALVQLAEELGEAALAGALADAIEAVAAARIPAELRVPRGATRNHLVQPRSYRRSLLAPVVSGLRRLLDDPGGDA